jgi:hypothetical protein
MKRKTEPRQWVRQNDAKDSLSILSNPCRGFIREGDIEPMVEPRPLGARFNQGLESKLLPQYIVQIVSCYLIQTRYTRRLRSKPKPPRDWRFLVVSAINTVSRLLCVTATPVYRILPPLFMNCGNVMSFETPENVYQHTIECLKAGSGNRCRALTANNAITATVPMENYLALQKAYRKFFTMEPLVLGET